MKLHDRQEDTPPFLTWYAEFPGIPDQAGAVRHKLQELLPPGAVLDDSLQVWGELVINAIQHTRSGNGGIFGVELEWDPEQVRLVVYDQGSSEQPLPMGFDDQAESGKGLRIVEALSLGWGFIGSPEGRAVWADEPSGGALPPRPDLAGWVPTEPVLAQLQADYPQADLWYEKGCNDLEAAWWAAWTSPKGDREYVYVPSLRCLQPLLSAYCPRFCSDTWFKEVACGPRDRRRAPGTRPAAASPAMPVPFSYAV